MFDWKVLLFGKSPKTFKESKRQLKTYKFYMYLWVLVVLFILFGVVQQRAEVVDCWFELEGYRVSNFSSGFLGVISDGVCFVSDDSLVCGVDNISLYG